MGLKELILQKGWAGTTFSRPETVARLNPITQKLIELNSAYEYAIEHLIERDVAKRLEDFQRTSRTDIAKLRESVLSCGGVPRMGVDLDDVTLDADDAGMLRQLRDMETSFLETVEAEQKENHQIRSRAILGVVNTSSQERLTYLRDRAKKSSPDAG